ncbi:MAG TPA: pantoate--beta-alanine ligase [Bacteroidales bacterium]|jgi:pantoate--beta-alanine ligase|nr:pantoate--beta-alanine ligase [Bacteroidales bacterium]HRR53364.1 pantoate--beta-alanine ligase [Bacteroidales bacterium]
MKVFTKIKELQEYLADQKHPIGLVPTMGALHQGHLSLIEHSKKENATTVVSIFVNPVQFNDKKDFDKYPRLLDDDLNLLETYNCDVVFAPSVDEMYPEPPKESYDFGYLDKILEGAYRPGHFNGVAIVVNRLFHIIKPDRAYFGKKDYQQYVIIKELVKQQNLPIEIIAVSILREPNGLAMSSRNLRLSENELKLAPEIYKALLLAKNLAYKKSINEVKQAVIDHLSQFPDFKIEYVEIVNADTLKTINDWNEGKSIILIATWLGDVRLIDNMELF